MPEISPEPIYDTRLITPQKATELAMWSIPLPLSYRNVVLANLLSRLSLQETKGEGGNGWLKYVRSRRRCRAKICARRVLFCYFSVFCPIPSQFWGLVSMRF